MTRFYRLLLRLYPERIRDEFGDEMTAVFEAARHDGGGLWFLLRECGGVVVGASRERTLLPRLAPAALGVLIAGALHWLAYRLLGAVPDAVSRLASSVTTGSGREAQLALGLMAVGTLVFLVPFVVAVSHLLHQRVNASRLRPVR